LELTDAAGTVGQIAVKPFGPVRRRVPGGVEYKSEAGMRSLLTSAVDLVHTLLRGERFDVEAAVKARKLSRRTRTRAEHTSHRRRRRARGHSMGSGDEQSIVRLGYGKYRRYVESTIADSTRVIGVDIAGR
jgi:cyanophycin synthetase